MVAPVHAFKIADEMVLFDTLSESFILISGIFRFILEDQIDQNKQGCDET